MPEPCSRLPSCRRTALAALGLLAALGCQELVEPYPQPLPPNVDITATPAPGSSVAVAEADSIVLRFSRPMDPTTMRLVRRISFLLPISIADFDGRWNTDHTRVAFHLDRFPVQPGATYEAVFTGFRTADGALYNGGPYRLEFHTRGHPDFFPMRPHARVERRLFCHHPSSDADCAQHSLLESSAAGADSVELRAICIDCGTPDRRDLYRRRSGVVEWLGWDRCDSTGGVLRAVRWPVPPPLLATPSTPGPGLEAPAQAAADGTRLEAWRATHSGADDPVYLLGLSGLPIQIAFGGSAVLELDFTLAEPGFEPEHHREFWWLYPGVGLVRREVHISRPGSADSYDLQTFVPTLDNLAAH